MSARSTAISPCFAAAIASAVSRSRSAPAVLMRKAAAGRSPDRVRHGHAEIRIHLGRSDHEDPIRRVPEETHALTAGGHGATASPRHFANSGVRYDEHPRGVFHELPAQLTRVTGRLAEKPIRNLHELPHLES